jgi:hypothetical protein
MFRLLFAILAILVSGMNWATVTVTVTDSRRPRPEGVMIALAEKIN